MEKLRGRTIRWTIEHKEVSPIDDKNEEKHASANYQGQTERQETSGSKQKLERIIQKFHYYQITSKSHYITLHVETDIKPHFKWKSQISKELFTEN